MNLPGNLGQKLSQVRAWAGEHKAVLGLGAVGVVGLLALRSRSAGSAEGDASLAPADATGITDPQAATVAGYDSSANDVYSALQPQVDQTQTLIRKLTARIKKDQKANRRITRQLQRLRKRRKKPIKGHHTPPTKPVKKAKRLSATRGQVTGGAARLRSRPAPAARPRAVQVTRRPTTLGQAGQAAGTNLRQVAAANRGVQPGTRLPVGTRVTIPTSTRR